MLLIISECYFIILCKFCFFKDLSFNKYSWYKNFFLYLLLRNFGKSVWGGVKS